MRIAKSIFVRPGSNDNYGMVAIALSFFVFAYSSRFGQASILLYYALWFPLVLMDYRNVLGSYQKQLWIFAFGVLTCLSIFWSAVPSVSARAAIQYMTHIVCALIATVSTLTAVFALGYATGNFGVAKPTMLWAGVLANATALIDRKSVV